MLGLLRHCFYLLLIKPVVKFVLGLNVYHRERLPLQGPAIIAANHNSHFDTLVLMSLFPSSCIPIVHPVAAADYFLKKKWLAWFSLNIIGIIPIQRKPSKAERNIFANIEAHLARENIILYFPEGSRGAPEQMAPLKKGIVHLARANPDVPIYPIKMKGLGKVLPKDESLFVPFVIDVTIEQPLYWQDDADTLLAQLEQNLS